MEYALIGKTEFYGPATKYRLVEVFESRGEAEEAAAEWNPDFNPQFGCAELAHNQAAAECGIVGEIVYAGDTNPAEDWTLMPSDLESELLEDELRAVELCEDGEALVSELEGLGYLVLAGEGQSRDYYLVKF